MNALRLLVSALAACALAACTPHAPRAASAVAPPASPAPAPPSIGAAPGIADAPAPVPAPAATASAVATPLDAHPALWRIAKGRTVIWLFGTIHALPDGVTWQTAPIVKATAAADTLVLETVLDRNPAHAGALLFGMGNASGLPPVLDRAPADRRTALAAMIARGGLRPAMLDSLKTWTAALLLVAVELKDMNLSADNGVEPQLEARFRAAGKPIAGLETPDQQLGYFDHLSEDAQRAFLGAIADDPAKMRSEFGAMLGAWARGDEAGIAATFDDDIKTSPELSDALVTRRNAAWVDWIAARLQQPGKVFLAVGAGHLAGPGSVVALLRARGIEAKRVE